MDVLYGVPQGHYKKQFFGKAGQGYGSLARAAQMKFTIRLEVQSP